MIDLIRLGDTFDRGGKVITASGTMLYGGRRVRQGDLVTCPLRSAVNPNVILEGDASIADYCVHRRASRDTRQPRMQPDLEHRLVKWPSHVLVVYGEGAR